jgi:hypothetical protein
MMMMMMMMIAFVVPSNRSVIQKEAEMKLK